MLKNDLVLFLALLSTRNTWIAKRPILLFALTFALVACGEPQRSAEETQRLTEEVMSEFYLNPGPEDTLMDPLIVAGSSVYLTVIDAVKDPDMPRRRYAISFLGNEEVSEALPLLFEIFNDDSELEYFRGDALVAIYKIDKLQAQNLANLYDDSEGMLGKYVSDVLEEATYLMERRSLRKARRRWHD